MRIEAHQAEKWLLYTPCFTDEPYHLDGLTLSEYRRDLEAAFADTGEEPIVLMDAPLFAGDRKLQRLNEKFEQLYREARFEELDALRRWTVDVCSIYGETLRPYPRPEGVEPVVVGEGWVGFDPDGDGMGLSQSEPAA